MAKRRSPEARNRARGLNVIGADERYKLTVAEYIDINFAQRLIEGEAVRQATEHWSRQGPLVDALRRADAAWTAIQKINNPVIMHRKAKSLRQSVARELRRGFRALDRDVFDALRDISFRNSRVKYQFIQARKRIGKRQTLADIKRIDEARTLRVGSGPPGSRWHGPQSRERVIARFVNAINRRYRTSFIGLQPPRKAWLIKSKTFRRWLSTVQRTLAQASIASAEFAAIKEVAKKYRWWSIMDHRTTERCQYLHRKIFPATSRILPPQHYNCRSEVHPVFDDRKVDKRLTERATSYQAWLRAQPEGIQNQIMGGKKTGDLFRQGKVSGVPVWRSRQKMVTKDGKLVRGRVAAEFNRRTKQLVVRHDPRWNNVSIFNLNR